MRGGTLRNCAGVNSLVTINCEKAGAQLRVLHVSFASAPDYGRRCLAIRKPGPARRPWPTPEFRRAAACRPQPRARLYRSRSAEVGPGACALGPGLGAAPRADRAFRAFAG